MKQRRRLKDPAYNENRGGSFATSQEWILRGTVLLVGCAWAAIACSTAAQQTKAQQPTDVVATVGGTTITLAQVDEVALQQQAGSFGNVKLSQALYLARRAALDELVGNLLISREASARRVERDALVMQEVSSKVTTPTDAEIDAWYQGNKDRLRGAALESVRPAIREYLIQERTNTARQAFLERLKEKTPVTLSLEPPRHVLAAAESPAKGPANAPVEIVEFSDFQCPYCLAANPTVTRVIDTYGDRIRFVYRNYPLPNHPQARPAAEAAQCANAQGRFWPYHDRLFANPSKLSDDELKRAAAELGLDTARFNACFESHQFKTVVDADVLAGQDAGVTGTPAFFINGRELTGAQPFEQFQKIIDEELQLKKR
jgi:protein-disulfide isomerase